MKNQRFATAKCVYRLQQDLSPVALRVCWILAVLLIFGIHWWSAWHRHFGGLPYIISEHDHFGEDVTAFYVMGRQMVEHGVLPTFYWHGYMYHAPTQVPGMFFPAILLGFHVWLLPLVMGLYGVLLPLLFALVARFTISKRAALPAFLLTGATDVFVLYYVMSTSWPFITLIALSVPTALLCMRWVHAQRDHDRPPGGLYCAAVGLLFGLLFYTHPVSVITLIGCGLFLLLGLGRRLFSWRLLPTVAGGIVSSLPFWIYWYRYMSVASLQHLWGSKPYRALHTLRDYLFSADGFFAFMGSPSGQPFMRAVTLFCVLLVALNVVYRLRCWWVAGGRWRALRDGWQKGFPIPLWAYGVCVVLSALVLMRKLSGMAAFAGPSHLYATEIWYWFMLAVVAVLHALSRRNRAAARILTVALILFSFASLLTRYPTSSPALRQLFNDMRADAHDIAEQGLDPLLITRGVNGGMYYALAPRRLILADGFRPFGLPIEVREVETAPVVSVAAALNENTLGKNRWDSIPLRTLTVHHHFRQPPNGRWIPDTQWQFDAWDSSSNPEQVQDGNYATAWRETAGYEGERVWTVQLQEPASIGRVVLYAHRPEIAWRPYTYTRIKAYYLHRTLFSSSQLIPNNVVIEGRTPSGQWETLVTNAYESPYHWDGGRLFHCYERSRFDIRFEPTTVTALRLRDRYTDPRPRVISQLLLFEVHPDEPGLPPGEWVEHWLDLLRERGIKRVYAGRYLSAQLALRWPDVQVWRPAPLLPPDHSVESDGAWPWFSGLEPLNPTHSALITEIGMAAHTQQQLTRAGIPFRSEAIGPWQLFTFPEADAQHAHTDLVWNGWACLQFPGKPHAWREYEKAQTLWASDHREAALKALDHAIRVYPRFYAAGTLRHQWQPYEETERKTADWYRVRPPENPLTPPVVFAPGIELVGLDVDRTSVTPGDVLTLRTIWRVPEARHVPALRPIQFTHLVGPDRYTINDDHTWLPAYTVEEIMHPLPDEWFVSERTLHIPEDAPAGSYDFHLGLIPSVDAPRAHAHTRHPDITIRRNAVRIPGVQIKERAVPVNRAHE